MTSPSDALSGRRVLAVGGRGFVGAHLVRALANAGATVHLFGPAMADDRMAPVPGVGGETIGSLEDGAAIARALAASGADDLVSCAGFGAGRLGLLRSGEGDRDAAMAINVVGHDRLLEAAAAHGIRRVVWTSSTVVYGPARLYGLDPVDETAGRAPATVYGLTKAMAEEASAFRARRHGMGVVGLRLPLVLGPGLWYAGAAAALAEFFAAARRGGPAQLSFHDEPTDFVDVADVGPAVVACLRCAAPPSAVYNLRGFTARASEFVEAVRLLAPGIEAEFVRADAPDALLPLVSGERIRAEVGWTARRDCLSFVRAMLSDDAR